MVFCMNTKLLVRNGRLEGEIYFISGKHLITERRKAEILAIKDQGNSPINKKALIDG